MPIPFQISDQQLRYDAQRASFLNLGARGIDFVFQFVSMAILARLLTPADFGVFAMATPFVWILMTFGDLGLASAVLQQRDLSEGQASAVFLINLVAGIAFGGLFLLSAPLLGAFYGDPEVTQVAAALSLMFVFSGFTAVQQALLRRALMFDTLLRAQIAASLVSSVMAVTFALKGAGYWALAIRALADPLVYGIVVWASTGWMPTRAEWDDTTRALLRYGRYVVGSSLLFSIGRHANNVLIGWRYGSTELGPFALANRLLLLPAQQISWPLGQVMVPALSRLQGDPDRLKRWYLKLLRLVTFASFPPLFSLALCANDVVHVIAGPQWGHAADILVLFAPVAALQVGYASTDWLMRSQGQADRFFRWTVIDTTARLLGCVLGLPWGAIGVAAGLATANLVLFLPGFAYAAKGTTIRLVDTLEAMLPCVLLMVVTLAAVWALRHFIAQDWTPFPRLLLTGVTIGAIMACGAVWMYGRSALNLQLLRSEPRSAHGPERMQGTGTHATASKGQHSSKRPLPAGRSYADRMSPNREGLVSVIIPAYNDAATVERTVSSVLNQTYSDLEVLVVDDGSTDQTAALVQSMANVDHRIRLLQKPNGGLASARNHGIVHAAGEFIAPIDADDLWHPEKIRKQMAVMRDRGDRVGLVYCWSRAIDEQDRVLWDVTPCNLHGSVYAALIIRNFLSSGAPLVRKCCAEAVGGYDTTLVSRGAPCCEDLKFNLDIAERCDFDLVPEFLFSYRVRAGSMSTNIDAMLRSRRVVIEEARARHPELPNKLFRWASAHQDREFGLAHLSGGRLLTGARLLLTALREDPFTTLPLTTMRAFARLPVASGFGKLARAKLQSRDAGGVLGRKFLEVDPAEFCGRPRATWSRRRLAYITELPVQRSAAVLRTTGSA